MEARGAVPPHGGEKGQPDFELVEQRPADVGQIGLSRRELLPRHHSIPSRLTASAVAIDRRLDAVARRSPATAPPCQGSRPRTVSSPPCRRRDPQEIAPRVHASVLRTEQSLQDDGGGNRGKESEPSHLLEFGHECDGYAAHRTEACP